MARDGDEAEEAGKLTRKREQQLQLAERKVRVNHFQVVLGDLTEEQSKVADCQQSSDDRAGAR